MCSVPSLQLLLFRITDSGMLETCVEEITMQKLLLTVLLFQYLAFVHFGSRYVADACNRHRSLARVVDAQ